MLQRALKIWILIGIAVLSAVSLLAQDAPKYSNEFLTIGVGARALGMGNSVIATSGDVHAGYWNPAGLTNIKRSPFAPSFEGGLMHSAYFAGLANYDYLGTAIPIEGGVIGVSFLRFGVDDIQNTINLIDPGTGQLDYSRITKFSTADYAGIISFAKQTSVDGLSLGANAKIIHRVIGEFASAWGFGLDVGAQYQKGNWQFGAVARDITSTFNAWSYTLDQNTKDVFDSTGNDIPDNNMEVTLPRFIGGGAYTFYFLSDRLTATPEANLTFTFDGERPTLISSDPISIDPALGVEFGFKDLVFLRGGIGDFQRVRAQIGDYETTSFKPSFGVGIQLDGLFGIGNLAIDYALTDIGDQTLLYSNVFSLRFGLLAK